MCHVSFLGQQVKGQGHTGCSNFCSLGWGYPSRNQWSTISSYCWMKDCFRPSSSSSIRWPSFLFQAIPNIWPIGCWTQCHQYGWQKFPRIYMFIMWSFKRINSFKVFSGMLKSDSFTSVAWRWNWTENKTSPWLPGVTSIIPFIS